MRCNYIAIGAIFVAFKRPRLVLLLYVNQSKRKVLIAMVHTISTIMLEHADDEGYYAHGATGPELPLDYMPGAPLLDFMPVAVC